MSTNAIEAAGLTNVHTEDLGVLAFAQPKLHYFTYCTSQRCCAYRDSGGTIRYAARVKKTPTKKGKCPDCSSALLVRKGVRP